MTQLSDHWVTAEAMVRSGAWRQGFEDFRMGRPPRFEGRGAKALAYEYGRLTAAHLCGQGRPLPRIAATRAVPAHHLPDLVRALMDCAAMGDGPTGAAPARPRAGPPGRRRRGIRIFRLRFLRRG